MQTAEPFPPIRTAEEFIAWEDEQEERFEFLDGAIVMMTGGTLAHNQICGNLGTQFRDRLGGGPCRAFVENVKLKVDRNVLYPDLLVVCGPLDMKATWVKDPVLVAEVLSASSRKGELDRKRRIYLSHPGLQYYLVVSQDECLVDLYSRAADATVLLQSFGRFDEDIPLPALSISLPVGAVYDGSGVEPPEAA